MRVERRIAINADRDAVWKIVGDPDCYPLFMTSLERWETANEQPPGAGARYTVHWKIGSVPVGGLIEVVEFDESRDLAWVGITGSPCVAESGGRRNLRLHRRPDRRASGRSHSGRNPEAPQEARRVLGDFAAKEG